MSRRRSVPPPAATRDNDETRTCPAPARDQWGYRRPGLCGNPLPQARTGRPREYCSDGCRKAAHRDRAAIAERARVVAEAEQRKIDEARHRAQLAARLVDRIVRDPAGAAGQIASWMEPDRWDYDRAAKYRTINDLVFALGPPAAKPSAWVDRPML